MYAHLVSGNAYLLISGCQKVKMKVAQSCLTLCHPMDCSLPSSSVHRILQARILEYPFPSSGDLPNPGTEAGSPTLQADSLPSETPGKPQMSFSTLSLEANYRKLNK